MQCLCDKYVVLTLLMVVIVSKLMLTITLRPAKFVIVNSNKLAVRKIIVNNNLTK